MFGIELEARMKALGLSGQQLAAGLGMKQTRISEMVTERRNVYPFVADSLTTLEAELTNAVEAMLDQIIEAAGIEDDDPDLLAEALEGSIVRFAPHFEGAERPTQLSGPELEVWSRFQRNLALTACGRLYVELSQLGIQCEIVPGMEGESWVEIIEGIG